MKQRPRRGRLGRRRPRPQSRCAPHYANTDLVLRSTEDLSALCDALAPGLFVLVRMPDEPGFAVFEVPGCRLSPSDEDVLALCGAVEALPGALHALWDRCTQRDFDIGFGSGWRRDGRSRGRRQRVTAAALRRVAALGGTVTITVYRLWDEDDDGRRVSPPVPPTTVRFEGATLDGHHAPVGLAPDEAARSLARAGPGTLVLTYRSGWTSPAGALHTTLSTAVVRLLGDRGIDLRIDVGSTTGPA